MGASPLMSERTKRFAAKKRERERERERVCV